MKKFIFIYIRYIGEKSIKGTEIIILLVKRLEALDRFYLYSARLKNIISLHSNKISNILININSHIDQHIRYKVQ